MNGGQRMKSEWDEGLATNAESRKLTILIDRCRSRLRLPAVRKGMKREEERFQERVLTMRQRIALLGMLFFAFMHSRERVGEFDLLRLRDLCPLSIRAICGIRGLAYPDRLPFERYFRVLPVPACREDPEVSISLLRFPLFPSVRSIV